MSNLIKFHGGLNGYVKRSVSATSAAVMQKVKDGINLNRPLLIPGPLGLVNKSKGSVGHFWIVTGYKDTGNADQSLIYLKDVYQKNSPQFSIKFGSFVYRIVEWRKKNNYSSSSMNFIIAR